MIWLVTVGEQGNYEWKPKRHVVEHANIAGAIQAAGCASAPIGSVSVVAVDTCKLLSIEQDGYDQALGEAKALVYAALARANQEETREALRDLIEDLKP